MAQVFDSAAYNPDVGATGPSVRKDTPRSAYPPPSPFGPSPLINTERRNWRPNVLEIPGLSRWPVSVVASASIVRIDPFRTPPAQDAQASINQGMVSSLYATASPGQFLL